MDLNYLFARHQVSLMRATSARCEPSRIAHIKLAQGYAGRIDTLRGLSGATGRMLAAPAVAA
ncbi:hypothetical protein SAMN06297144_0703 [Sphingomonas guangdongensis]|uniref:Uncharacterized protein n=1 Tax=Sphingomonas guangdongensis TaxID=1141890 RepID=A0A285QI43_9SPHN|nr:hypothetical protein [Sphingomonas guangdongensis]SOB79732.1 hypothetical protein SAMN06297144_0703 [Sphingomonas guangdongensis]